MGAPPDLDYGTVYVTVRWSILVNISIGMAAKASKHAVASGWVAAKAQATKARASWPATIDLFWPKCGTILSYLPES